MKIPARVVTLVVGNPLVADVTVEAGGVAVITAKGHGTTNIVALGNAGIVLMERPIEVQEPGSPRVVVFRGSTRQTYSCTPECSALVALGDTGKDYFDKEAFQELDAFKKALEQTTTRNVQAAAAGAEQAARHNRTRCQGHSVPFNWSWCEETNKYCDFSDTRFPVKRPGKRQDVRARGDPEPLRALKNA